MYSKPNVESISLSLPPPFPPAVWAFIAKITFKITKCKILQFNVLVYCNILVYRNMFLCTKHAI